MTNNASNQSSNTTKPKLLILCFSDLYRDVRVLKQINLFKDTYEVTTCGYGRTPAPGVAHVELSRHESKLVVWVRAALVRAHLYRGAYWSSSSVRQGFRRLRKSRYDAVLANDLDTSGLALAVGQPGGVHMDIHEYWPGLKDYDPAWKKLRKPYYEWMLRHYVTKAKSVTVVNDVTSERYQKEFGFASQVVPNMARYHDLEPSVVGETIRVVHAGGANPDRRLDDLMRAVAQVEGMTLDMYLVGHGTKHFAGLERVAKELGESIRIHEPLPSEQIVETMNDYDIGLHSLPPTNSNHLTTMPNKYYEFIQARLALVLGPSPTLKRAAANFGGAVIAKDYTPEALAEALRGLTREDIIRMKNCSHQAAKNLTAEKHNHVWEKAIKQITKTPQTTKQKPA